MGSALTEQGKTKVAILINLVAPYRAALFDRLSEEVDLRVFWTGWEGNRSAWPRAGNGGQWGMEKVPGLVVPRVSRSGGGVFDRSYLHIPWGVGRSLDAWDPDVVISWEMGFRTLAALRWGGRSGRPVWVCWESPEALASNVGPVRRWVRRKVQRQATGWFSFSQSATRYLSSLGCDPIVQLQNSVDGPGLDQEASSGRRISDSRPIAAPQTPMANGAEARLDRAADRPAILLVVAQLIRRKGVDVLLSSLARLRGSKGVTAELWIVGNGPEREALFRQARGLGLRVSVQQNELGAAGADAQGPGAFLGRDGRSRVRFLGELQQTELRSAYRSADALIVPSREEVWGLVVNEAILAGLPVAASVHVGAAEELVPRAAQFDPESAEEVDRVMGDAVAGELPLGFRDALFTLDEVAQRMTEVLVPSS